MTEGHRAIMVLYDKECPLCLRLAQYAQRHTGSDITYFSWQDYIASDKENSTTETSTNTVPDQLAVLVEDTIFKGTDAWQILLEHHPSLSSLSWIAKKMGLEQQTSRSLNRTGHLLRKLCPSCWR